MLKFCHWFLSPTSYISQSVNFPHSIHTAFTAFLNVLTPSPSINFRFLEFLFIFRVKKSNNTTLFLTAWPCCPISAHSYYISIPDAGDGQYIDVISNAIFNDDVAVMAADTATENSLHTCKHFHIANAISCRFFQLHMIFISQSIKFD